MELLAGFEMELVIASIFIAVIVYEYKEYNPRKYGENR